MFGTFALAMINFKSVANTINKIIFHNTGSVRTCMYIPNSKTHLHKLRFIFPKSILKYLTNTFNTGYHQTSTLQIIRPAEKYSFLAIIKTTTLISWYLRFNFTFGNSICIFLSQFPRVYSVQECPTCALCARVGHLLSHNRHISSDSLNPPGVYKYYE